jgi:hypothetical protein
MAIGVRTERFGAVNTPMYMSLTELFATIDKDNA